MSDLQVLSTNFTTHDKFELFDIPQNYSILINKLERLALGLDSAFNNLTPERKELEVGLTASNDYPDLLGSPLAAGRGPPPRATQVHNMDDVDLKVVVGDIWIGIILTLLIAAVIFFFCSCFLVHKFQQWKNSYRTNQADHIETCRRFSQPDFEAISLPSYTMVSGLPSYDDALEQFRKAGIILTPVVTRGCLPMVKLFERDPPLNSSNTKESSLSTDDGANGNNDIINAPDISSNAIDNTLLTVPSTTVAPQVIELSPEQLAALSQKRLSLQISFNNSLRHVSRPRSAGLYRQVNRNNLLRSRPATASGLYEDPPAVHRSSSSTSLSVVNEQSMSTPRRLIFQHRGSLY